MRARYLATNSLEGFAPHEALELLLFYAIPRKNVNPLAHRILEHFGSLSAVLNAPPEQLKQVEGVGESAAMLLSLVGPLVRYATRDLQGDKAVLSNYRDAKAYCKHLFDGNPEEVLYVVCLDAQGRVLRSVVAITGTIDEITIYPRTIVATALRHNAHSVLLAHNHPSGIREPSDADIRTTDLLREALGTVDIAVLDHVIYADGDCVSMEQWRQLQRIAPMLQSGAPKAAEPKGAQKRGSPLRETNDA